MTSSMPYFGSGGGGGSGYNPFDGGVLMAADGGAPPATSDPDYAGNAGLAVWGAAGQPGHLVIRLPKP